MIPLAAGVCKNISSQLVMLVTLTESMREVLSVLVLINVVLMTGAAAASVVVGSEIAETVKLELLAVIGNGCSTK